MIQINETGNYYAVFYFAAFTTSFVLRLAEGKKRGFPWLTWLALNLFSAVLFIVGTKAITVLAADWVALFTNFQMPAVAERSILGGMLAFIVVYFVARFGIGFKNNFLDAIAIPSAIGLSIQRLGCFFAGCCFGTPCSQAWAISYSPGSPAHILHTNNGLIDIQNAHSLAVHPVQLYYVASGVAIVALLLLLKKKIHSHGGLFALLVMLYSISRFAIEFFVDVSANQAGGKLFMDIKYAQWAMLLVAIAAGAVLALLHKKRNSLTSPTPVNENYGKSILLLALSFAIIVLFKNWFSQMELHLLWVLWFITIVLAIVFLYQMLYKPSARIIHLALAGAFIVLSSQTLKQTDKDSLYTWYNSITTTQTFGNYQGEIREMCGSHYYENKFSTTGFSFENTRVNKNNPYKWRNIGLYLQFSGAEQYLITETDYKSNRWQIANKSESNRIIYLSAMPYMAFNYKWFGFSTGLMVSNNELLMGNTYLWPMLNMRIGSENKFYMRTKIFNAPDTNLELPIYSVSAGTGFGEYRGSFAEIGLGYSDFAPMVLTLSAGYKTSNNLKISTSVNYGNMHNATIGIGLNFVLPTTGEK